MASKKKAPKKKKAASKKTSIKKKGKIAVTPPRRMTGPSRLMLGANAGAQIGRCLYTRDGQTLCADVTEAWCDQNGGTWDSTKQCPK
jgi:hypothetical protein